MRLTAIPCRQRQRLQTNATPPAYDLPRRCPRYTPPNRASPLRESHSGRENKMTFAPVAYWTKVQRHVVGGSDAYKDLQPEFLNSLSLRGDSRWAAVGKRRAGTGLSASILGSAGSPWRAITGEARKEQRV